jgi:hypothetical protein
MIPIPRILVVDPTPRLGHLVRAAMTLLGRRYILVDVPAPAEALDEVLRAEIDLAVTAYTLDGSMNGLEWAEKAIRGQAGTLILVVAAENDPSPDPTKTENVPYKYLPYSTGDNFLRAIRIGLDGEEVVAAEEGMLQSHLDLGPIPPLNVDAARAILLNTIRHEMGSIVGTIGGLISDRSGHIVVDEGATGYIDKSQIAALLGPTFAQCTRIAPQIGGHAWALKFFEGERYNIFALAVGYHYFILFLMDPSNRQAFGAVTRYGREGANKIADLLGDAAWKYSMPELPSPPAPAPVIEKTPAKARPDAPVPDEVSPLPTTPTSTDPQKLSSTLLQHELEPVGDIDIDVLFSQQGDDAAFDELFSAELLDTSLDQESVSYEEAQNMGLLGE